MSDRKNERNRKEDMTMQMNPSLVIRNYLIGRRKCYNVHTLPTIFCY